MLPDWIYTLKPRQKWVLAAALLFAEMGGMALLETLIAKGNPDLKELNALCELQLAGGIATIPANYAALSLLTYIQSDNVNRSSILAILGTVTGQTIGVGTLVFGMFFQGALGKLILNEVNQDLQWHKSYPSNATVLVADIGGLLCIGVLLWMAMMIKHYCHEPRQRPPIALAVEIGEDPDLESGLPVIEMAMVVEGQAIPPTASASILGSTSNPLHTPPSGLIAVNGREHSSRATN